VLAGSITRLHAYLEAGFPFSWRITVADNASTDGTLAVAESLAAKLRNVRVLHLDRKGRGLALRTAWMASDAAVVAYMDVDLSTGLDALLPLVAPLVSGHSDLAIGSRLAAGANVARGPRRELISKAYNLILRTVFSTRVRDAQCGFKAVRADIAHRLVPAIHDDEWFFDTELLLLAEHNGLRILEVPVDWHDDPDTRVNVVGTALEDLQGIARMAYRFAAGRGELELGAGRRRPFADDKGRRLVTFSIIGIVSTLVSLALFLLLRGPLGAAPAVVVALGATAVGNSWAHRRFTLGHRGRDGLVRHTLASAAITVSGIVLSVLALVSVDAIGGGTLAELAALAVAWTAATAARFGLLARWSAAPGKQP
jgi:putative flippase GtrA